MTESDVEIVASLLHIVAPSTAHRVRTPHIDRVAEETHAELNAIVSIQQKLVGNAQFAGNWNIRQNDFVDINFDGFTLDVPLFVDRLSKERVGEKHEE